VDQLEQEFGEKGGLLEDLPITSKNTKKDSMGQEERSLRCVPANREDGPHKKAIKKRKSRQEGTEDRGHRSARSKPKVACVLGRREENMTKEITLNFAVEGAGKEEIENTEGPKACLGKN